MVCLVARAGVEGQDSCIAVFPATPDVATAYATCNVWGGHFLSTRQSTWGTGGLADTIFSIWPTQNIYLGASRFVLSYCPCL